MGCGASLPISPPRHRGRDIHKAGDGVEMRQIQIMARKKYECESSGQYNSNVWTNTESEQRDDIFNDPVTQRIIKICGI
jgi:hypothetical protein